MNPSLAWRLGWRMFTAPGSSRLLLSSSLAMALGLVPLVVVLSIADGMIESISARTIETALYDVQIRSSSGGAYQPGDRAALETRLKAVPGFRGLWPEQRGFALAYGAGGKRLGLTLRGIDPRWPLDDPAAGRYLKAVSGTLQMEGNQVWIGREAAEKLGLKPGDELKLLTTRSQGALSLPRVTTATVAAVVSVGYQELDRLWLFVPLPLSLSLLDEREDNVFWGVKGDFPLEQTAGFLDAVRTGLGSGWQAVSWQTTGRSQFLNYQATRVLLAVVMGLVLLVAAVNVSTAMVTTVGERRRETAILKALGASDRLVLAQFFILGLGAGVLGTAVGLGGGMLIALSVNGLVSVVDALISLFTPGGSFSLLDRAYYLENIPVKFDAGALGLAAAGSVLLAVLCSWWPARRAAKERPLDVLRRA